jgi:hypothetical protein
MNTLNLYGVEALTLEEMRTTDGGIAPLLLAMAWGFGIGFPCGVAIGIAKYS